MAILDRPNRPSSPPAVLHDEPENPPEVGNSSYSTSAQALLTVLALLLVVGAVELAALLALDRGMDAAEPAVRSGVKQARQAADGLRSDLKPVGDVLVDPIGQTREGLKDLNREAERAKHPP